MNNSAAHTALVKSILLALGREEDLLVWQNTTGQFREPFSDRRISVGLPGSPDIIGVLRSPWCGYMAARNTPPPAACFLGIEAKTGRAVLSAQQRNFHARAGELGAILIVAHSVEEAVAAVEKARRG